MRLSDIQRLAAFAEGDLGGNPAGVWIGEALPSAEEMQKAAAEMGYSETAFAAPSGGDWRVRYFAPQLEVPFCGHATIALGAGLGARFGAETYALELNEARITVDAMAPEGREDWRAALVSPPSRSEPAKGGAVEQLLAAFGFDVADLIAPPLRAHAGADHLIWRFASPEPLDALGADMAYPFDVVRGLMLEAGFVTIMLATEESPGVFRARNAFAAGGVREDPATGAAAAAFTGALAAEGALTPNQRIVIRQGVEMGSPSRIEATAPAEVGAGIRVGGSCRTLFD